jgi:Tfp pilus assembly protein PilF
VQSLNGLIQLRKGSRAEARKAFDAALATDPNLLEATAGLVSLDLAAQNAAAARSRVEARVAQTPRDSHALVLAARTYAATGDLPATEQALRKAIEADPSDLPAYGLLGQLYLRQGKLEQAVAEFRKVAARQPRNVGARTMVAVILQTQGKSEDARKAYEEIVQIEPRAAVASNNLAWMYAEGGGNLDTALQLAQAAKSQLPEVPEVNDTLGYVYLKKGLPGLAVPPFEEAVEKDPGNPLYRYRLGLAFAQSGNKTRAKEEIERALSIKRDFDGATDAKKLLQEL